MLLMISRLGLVAILLSISLSSSVEAQNRMPPIPADKLSEAQRKAAAELLLDID